jgi:hypothetical protein
LQIRIVDVNTARILGRANELEFTTLRDLRGKLDAFLKEVTADITASATYQIGGRGPAGGWVFYDKGVVSGGWRYLEAAPAEAEFTATWDTAFARHPPSAAVGNWRLPAREELELMYRNLKLKGIGGFSNSWYWSSPQYDRYHSWVQNFGDGRQDGYPKGDSYSVRCVRAF